MLFSACFIHSCLRFVSLWFSVCVGVCWWLCDWCWLRYQLIRLSTWCWLGKMSDHQRPRN